MILGCCGDVSNDYVEVILRANQKKYRDVSVFGQDTGLKLRGNSRQGSEYGVRAGELLRKLVYCIAALGADL